MQQAMLQSNSRTTCGKIDDTETLAVRYVATTIGLRLYYSEVIELGIATLLALVIESKEGVARTLEGDELIA